MDPDRPESTLPADESTGAASDPKALVEQMVAAGEWPEPELLEAIARAGDPAVEPLIKILRTYPRGWPEEAPVSLAVDLLSTIRSPAAIPELIEVIRRYGGELGQEAAEALGRFGAVAFEPVLEACRDPEITGHARVHARSAAIYTARDDPARRARVAEVMRPMLADAIERFRLAMSAQEEVERDERDDEQPEDDYEAESGEGSEDDEGLDPDPSEARLADAQTAERENELDLNGEIFYLVNDLSTLADPKARNLIKAAFDEDMVPRFFLDEISVDERYRKGGETPQPAPDWLGKYRESYRNHLERLNRPAISAPVRKPTATSREAKSHEPPPPPVETIRKQVSRPGRNDPCWCGSGKKYKKCHLGKDVQS